MIGRKSIVGLSLLTALALCAFMAQGASAAFETATNLTAFTCVENGGNKDFSDAHCDNPVTAGTGKFGHVAIPINTKTKIETTNEATANETKEKQPAVLKGSLLGATVTTTCKTVSPGPEESYIENKEPKEKVHQIEGTTSLQLSDCITVGNGSACKAKEPIRVNTFFHGVEDKAVSPKLMALEFTPAPPSEKNLFFTLEFEGTCLVTKTEVSGTIRGTGTPAGAAKSGGATLNFLPADESLKAFGNVETFEGKFTTRMKEEGGVKGNPISVTTLT